MSKTIDYETRCNELEKKLHNLESLVCQHRKKGRELMEDKQQLARLTLEFACRAKIELADEILYRLEKGASKKELICAVLESLRNDLGNKSRSGRLQVLVNYLFDGILFCLDDDYPGISAFEKNLYCCMMINVKARILRAVFEFEKDNQVYYAQKALLNKIWKGGNRNRAGYAALLEKKDCAYWKNLLTLHNLTFKRNGKAKKDKN